MPAPKFVNEGQTLLVPFKGKMVRAEVVCAMGEAARMVNSLYKIDTWYRLDEMQLQR